MEGAQRERGLSVKERQDVESGIWAISSNFTPTTPIGARPVTVRGMETGIT